MSDPNVIAMIPKNNRETIRVALDEYRGANFVDIRIMVAADRPGAEPMFTKKGVAVGFKRIPELIRALQLALDEAARRGLLPKEAA